MVLLGVVRDLRERPGGGRCGGSIAARWTLVPRSQDAGRTGRQSNSGYGQAGMSAWNSFRCSEGGFRPIASGRVNPRRPLSSWSGRCGGTPGGSASARGALSHGVDLLSVRVEIPGPRRQIPGCLRVALGVAR